MLVFEKAQIIFVLFMLVGQTKALSITPPKHISQRIVEYGGCCGPVGFKCGGCTPEEDWIELQKENHGCCLPKPIKANGPQYWCCRCGYPTLQPFRGQPCCAGNC
uniref:Cnidarian restricted protein n=1 Tax=Clytia hemisphaerica TaxID=252671 RepID=A0A7M5WRC0_9CNID